MGNNGVYLRFVYGPTFSATLRNPTLHYITFRYRNLPHVVKLYLARWSGNNKWRRFTCMEMRTRFAKKNIKLIAGYDIASEDYIGISRNVCTYYLKSISKRSPALI